MDFELQMKAASIKKISSEIDEDEEGEENKEDSVVSVILFAELVLKVQRCHALMRGVMT